MAYQGIVIVIAMYIVENQFEVTWFKNVLGSLDSIVYGHGVILCAFIYPVNYYYFMRKKRLDIFYNRFKNASINTKRNRIVGYTSLILYWPIIMLVMYFVNYWFK